MTDTKKAYQDMTPEEKAEYQAKANQDHLDYLYNLYSEVVDSVLENYNVSSEVAIRAVADHCDTVEQQAIEEARQDLNDRAPEVAMEIGDGLEWDVKSEDNEDE